MPTYNFRRDLMQLLKIVTGANAVFEFYACFCIVRVVSQVRLKAHLIRLLAVRGGLVKAHVKWHIQWHTDADAVRGEPISSYDRAEWRLFVARVGGNKRSHFLIPAIQRPWCFVHQTHAKPIAIFQIKTIPELLFARITDPLDIVAVDSLRFAVHSDNQSRSV